MNKFQSLFGFDERLVTRQKNKEKFMTSIYCLFDPGQWKHYGAWIKSLGPNKTPYDDELPWVTYGAVDFIKKVITKDSNVFEYGSGGSTLFFGNKAKNLKSVEHNEQWFELLNKKLKQKKYKNVQYVLRKPVPLTPSQAKHEYFRSWREQGVSFKDYVENINEYPDNSFDFVSVDGRSRVACVKEAFSKVKPGGYILLDNSNRQDYFEAHLFMRDNGCEATHYFGLVGYETILAQTTIWLVKK